MRREAGACAKAGRNRGENRLNRFPDVTAYTCFTASTMSTPDRAGINREPIPSMTGAADNMALLVEGGKYRAWDQEATENWLSFKRAES